MAEGLRAFATRRSSPSGQPLPPGAPALRPSHERIRLQLRQREVLRIVGLRPAELVGDPPSHAAEDGVAEEADRHGLDACKPLLGDLGREVAAVHRLVKGRQRLRTQGSAQAARARAATRSPRLRAGERRRSRRRISPFGCSRYWISGGAPSRLEIAPLLAGKVRQRESNPRCRHSRNPAFAGGSRCCLASDNFAAAAAPFFTSRATLNGSSHEKADQWTWDESLGTGIARGRAVTVRTRNRRQRWGTTEMAGTGSRSAYRHRPARARPKRDLCK
jgi:hypothetical protein